MSLVAAPARCWCTPSMVTTTFLFKCIIRSLPLWFSLKDQDFELFRGFHAKIGISGKIYGFQVLQGIWNPQKSALKSIKMREIPIFAKSQYLENHMGRAWVRIFNQEEASWPFILNRSFHSFPLTKLWLQCMFGVLAWPVYCKASQLCNLACR